MPERRALWKLLSDNAPLLEVKPYRVVLMDGVSRAAAILRSKERLLMLQISASTTRAIYSLKCFLDLLGLLQESDFFTAEIDVPHLPDAVSDVGCGCISFSKSKQEIITIRFIYWRHYRPTKRRVFALENMVGWGRGDVWPKKLEKERLLKSGSSQLLWV